MPAPSSRYRRVRIAGWSCLSAAGDTAATWTACRDGRTALTHEAGIGWCGRTPAARAGLDALAVAAAAPAWAAVAGIPGIPALAAAASKGDVAALARALAGEHRALVAAEAGLPTARLARALGVRLHLPVPAVAACSTGISALLDAADLLERGAATRALAGAADASLTPLVVAGFRALGVVAAGEAPPTCFAGTGGGFAPAEGAGFLALAERGPWRLVAGVRLADARHETAFLDPATLASALAALQAALPAPDLLVVHGTGTAAGDAYERAALDAGPWAGARRLACKPAIGHCLGASGTVELAAALEAPVARLWKLSLGFGGHLAAVAVAREA